MRKHLDKECEDAGTTHEPSSISSVSGRMVSEVERRGEQAVRPPDQTTCSEFQSRDELGDAGCLLGGELADAVHYVIRRMSLGKSN